MYIHCSNTFIQLNSDTGEPELIKSLEDTFPRRYLPDYTIGAGGAPRPDAVIYYRVVRGGSFRPVKIVLGTIDEYHVEGPLPAPYSNESPYFFLLQVLARSLAKNKLIMLTDAVSFTDTRGRTHLVLGYPHDGKSSLLAIAYSRGDEILSTENTVVEVRGDGLYVVNGSRILVYDPRVHTVYGVRWIEPHDKTRHGYHVIDLGRSGYPPRKINDITLIHSSYRSSGAEYEKVSGRKILKTLWHFATALLRGTDYYYPNPMYLGDEEIDEFIRRSLEMVAEHYSGSFMEAFGSHIEIYEKLVEEARA